MNTVTEKISPMYDQVIHIAFGCACVRTFHVEQPTFIRCPVHGDSIISTTTEYLEKPVAA